jgi:hypothetical protein
MWLRSSGWDVSPEPAASFETLTPGNTTDSKNSFLVTPYDVRCMFLFLLSSNKKITIVGKME